MSAYIVSKDKFLTRLISKTLGDLCKKETSTQIDGLLSSDFELSILDLTSLDAKDTLDKLDQQDINLINSVAVVDSVDSFLLHKCVGMGFGLVLSDDIDPLLLRAFAQHRIMKKKSRMKQITQAEELVIGETRINPVSQQIFYKGMSCSLSPTEFKIFGILSTYLSKSVSRETIKNKVWGASYAIAFRSIDSYISRLRSKIIDTPFSITSKKNDGYTLTIKE